MWKNSLHVKKADTVQIEPNQNISFEVWYGIAKIRSKHDDVINF